MPAKHIVFINKSNYFEGIPPEVWAYQVGGYQVMEKYLEDRKGRVMDNPAYYCKIATALKQTIAIQDKIDAVFEKIDQDVME